MLVTGWLVKSLLAEVEFGIYDGASGNAKRFRGSPNAREEIGCEPEDDAFRV